MSLRWLVLLVSLYSVSANAYEWPIEIIEYVDNARVVASLSQDDIDASAEWKPAGAAPTLSLKKVAAIARDFADSNKDWQGATLEEIALRRIPHHEDKWHYMVKMKTEMEDQVSYHYLVVLMNGKAIPALREPESVR